MPKLAANLTMLYNEFEFLDRFDAAAKSGFAGVEYLFPYAYPKDQIAERLARHRLTQVLHNLPAGDWAAGERGIACDPRRVGEFQDGVAKAIEYATTLGCVQLNCLAGIAPQGIDVQTMRATFVANLRFAADKLGAAGIKLLTEPINTFDIPGFFLSGTRQALDIIRDVGSSNLFLQYDVYHMQRMEGELANTIKTHLPQIAHVQIADNPGRNEPGTGEINYRFLFGFLDSIGYTGWIGCEYNPKGTTVGGLGWRAAHGV
ncbi:MAG TPA: hydroxypyruvate isomerase [Casimicrobiaceae bacterium]|nr:hydroxypyruvate isomerase [Casimicrobiaceae bacterium]